MVKICFYNFLFFFFFTSVGIFSQNEQIDNEQSELSKLRDEIQQLEYQLEQKSITEKKSIEDFEKINKQSFLINKIVINLRNQEIIKQNEIEIQTRSIADLEKEIQSLKKNYEKYVIANYKNGNYSEWQSLLDSKSFQNAIIRLEYLKRFSASRANDLLKLKKNKNLLIDAKEKLEIEKKAKQILTKEKTDEEKSLKEKLNDKKSLLTEIKKDKSKITKSVNDKRKAEKKIRDLIINLVEESEKKLKEKAEVNVSEIAIVNETITKKENIPTPKYDIDLTTSKFSSFKELKGKINYPISKGKIIRNFGEQKNPALNTVTINYGIDIKASGDLIVKCVAEGVVSALEWLPGYGTVLIISHKGNYRTVYGHLSEVTVAEGNKVQTGEKIGKVGENVEGNILHFEIWNARENVNPVSWLKNN